MITQAAKFFLFDVGVAGAISKRTIREERGESFGHAFEHFILMELLAHRSYTEARHEIRFWRTKTGLEVDFILGEGEVAVEVKGAPRVDAVELQSLRAFAEEAAPRKAFVVSNERHPRRVGDINVVPWREFLARLWGGEIIG